MAEDVLDITYLFEQYSRHVSCTNLPAGEWLELQPYARRIAVVSTHLNVATHKDVGPSETLSWLVTQSFPPA